MKYKVKRGIFLEEDKKIEAGEVVEMAEKQAKVFGNALEKIKSAKPKKEVEK